MSEQLKRGAVTHELKVWPEYFDALESGEKSFEFRKDDRKPRFAVGDVLRLREYFPGGLGDDAYGCLTTVAPYYTGLECRLRVTYVARGGVIPDGFCVMSVVPLAAPSLEERETPSEAEVRAAIAVLEVAKREAVAVEDFARAADLRGGQFRLEQRLAREATRETPTNDALRKELERVRVELENIGEEPSYSIDPNDAWHEAMTRVRKLRKSLLSSATPETTRP